jgi:hypothetical protein
MNMSNIKTPSVADMVAHLEAHAAFLKTPEGKEWKVRSEAIVDYISLAPTVGEPSEQTKKLFESIRTILADKKIAETIPTGIRLDQNATPGFKRGELIPIFAQLPVPVERRTNIVFNVILQKMRDDPNYKPVFRLSLELDAQWVEERFQQVLKSMGIEITTNQEGKQQ